MFRWGTDISFPKILYYSGSGFFPDSEKPPKPENGFADISFSTRTLDLALLELYALFYSIYIDIFDCWNSYK